MSLKPGWRRVKFGDVVRQVKDRVDPETSGIERYIAGEHMDTDDLRLRRWGDVGEGYLGPAFHMRFRPGHVLYGSRRTYLRKVAVADFEGVCANTTFVIEPSTDDLLLEFLAYVMTAEAFHEHSIKQSKGSVNPYINFTDLKWYEFALPPIDEQKRIVEVLEAVAGALEQQREVSQRSTDLIAGLLSGADGVATVKLQDVCRETITYGIVQAGPYVDGGVPYIRVSDMTEADVLAPALLSKTSTAIADRYRRSACEPGDLVFALRGPIGLTRVVPEDLRGANLTQGTARLAPNTAVVSSACLQWLLRSPGVQRQYRRVQKGSTFQELSLGALRSIEIASLDGDEQVRFVVRLTAAAKVSSGAASAISTLRDLSKQTREHLLNGAADVR